MAKQTPADVVFYKHGSGFRANPPTYHAFPLTRSTVSFFNLTGGVVQIWSPGQVLLRTPQTIAPGVQIDLPINPDIPPGAYVYTAYVDPPANQPIEGSSPPEIIIDK